MAAPISSFNRPDLSTRMARRRRLPHPDSNTNSTILQSVSNRPPNGGLTYSNYLGILDPNILTTNGDYRTPGSSYPSFDAFQFNIPEPGPSHNYNHSYNTPVPAPQAQEHIIESGWIQDIFGRDIYVGHGTIEEVVDDNAGSSSNYDAEDIYGTPLPKKRVLVSLKPGEHAPNGFMHEEISYISTPPPCPRPRNLPSLRATSTGSEHLSFKATSVPAMPTASVSTTAPVLDPPTEVALVTENLALLASSMEDIQFMNTFLLAKSVEHDLSEHIDICAHIEKSLVSLRGTLTLRTQIGAEEWNVRSPSWHQKHGKRLLSLRTTLQRLARMRRLIEIHSLRPRQRSAILTKLEQHEAKLADLASKYRAAFDRLRLRHLHFLLSQSHKEARRQNKTTQKAPLASWASFERRWKEGKTFRATLRNAYHEELYHNNQRTGRQSSAQ
ncbi:hypothetical protein B0H34DRAFT_700651 [Crassisporium funariophilum]|nr:hypothetical protein B0H34DRAFT_700651 [Crassisporium funariophilum]